MVKSRIESFNQRLLFEESLGSASFDHWLPPLCTSHKQVCDLSLQNWALIPASRVFSSVYPFVDYSLLAFLFSVMSVTSMSPAPPLSFTANISLLKGRLLPVLQFINNRVPLFTCSFFFKTSRNPWPCPDEYHCSNWKNKKHRS